MFIKKSLDIFENSGHGKKMYTPVWIGVRRFVNKNAHVYDEQELKVIIVA